MEFINNCLGSCTPAQIVNVNYAFRFEELNIISIYNGEGCEIEKENIEYAYSLDGVCWSCYMTYDEFLETTVGLNTDFYVRFSVASQISKVEINGTAVTDYSTSLKSGFTLTTCDGTTSSNTWNPYANLDCAISLQQQLTENIACMIGIPIYYFKLAPNKGSKDITFKEYTLMDVEAVKQIKLIVTDGQMPSSKPEFNDWGLEWQTDWECEISKGMFATAFGNTAQPMEGDFIWIPMMKRMWMVNEAYEEKKDAFMWNATTFKVALVKYQEKGSVNLGDTETLVNTFVKNKYDDLFGDLESIGSGVEVNEDNPYTPNAAYPVYESDSTRKYVTVDTMDNSGKELYQKGTLVADMCYKFTGSESTITYQRGFCGKNGSLSFVITPLIVNGNAISDTLLSISNIKIKYTQDFDKLTLTVSCSKKSTMTLVAGDTYFVYLRWSKTLNNVEFSAAKYSHPDMALYRLQPHHYYFDIDNLYSKVVTKYNIEMNQPKNGEVSLHNFVGSITNIKLFNAYIQDISELLQMFPTNEHLLINDTARKLITIGGVGNR